MVSMDQRVLTCQLFVTPPWLKMNIVHCPCITGRGEGERGKEGPHAVLTLSPHRHSHMFGLGTGLVLILAALRSLVDTVTVQLLTKTD